VKGEEYAEHDTEETQYRRRMRIESGIQVVRHVPTIRRDLLSAALIGHATFPMPGARNQIQHVAGSAPREHARDVHPG
jgi:hypothetical protein